MNHVFPLARTPKRVHFQVAGHSAPASTLTVRLFDNDIQGTVSVSHPVWGDGWRLWVVQLGAATPRMNLPSRSVTEVSARCWAARYTILRHDPAAHHGRSVPIMMPMMP